MKIASHSVLCICVKGTVDVFQVTFELSIYTETCSIHNGTHTSFAWSRINEWKKEWKDEWMNEWMNEWMIFLLIDF